MRRFVLSLLMFALASITPSVAQDSIADNHSRIKSSGKYSPFDNGHSDFGYFRKVYSDAGGPRFMVADENDNFRFGIGGTIHATMFFDFNGSLEGSSFTTWNIPVPTDYAGQSGLTMGSSKLNFKAIGKLGGKQMVAFVEIGVGTSTGNAINLRHAYFSYGGLTVGHTYSFFMDLAAGPMTVDLQGPNTQISIRHPLIGYTFKFGNHWKLAAALERQELKINASSSAGVSDEFQECPDIAFNTSYTFDRGHLQLAALLRYLYYYRNSPLSTTSERSGTKLDVGFGGALSGSFNFTKNTSLSFQSVVGRGVGAYIQDLSESKLDLINMVTSDSASVLKTAPMYGGYFSVQHNWTQRLVSSLIYGYVHLYHMPGYVYNYDDCYNFNSSHYVAANLFWNVSDYFIVGVEYLYGVRQNVFADGSYDSGHANRVDLMLSYSF